MSFSYTQLKSIKLGDTLFECQSGINQEFEVSEEPREVFNESLDSNQLSWKGINPDGETVNFMITEKLSHYGPRIYNHKAYTEPNDFKDGVLKSHE